MFDNVAIETCTPADLNSLSHCTFRANIHNAYMMASIPDTPKNRGWFKKAFMNGLGSPGVTILIARDTNALEDPLRRVMGQLTLQRRSDPASKEGDLWAPVPFTEDMNFGLLEKITAPLKGAAERVMEKGKSYTVVQTFGVDAIHQRSGIGTRLMERACAVADERGEAMFVEANFNAVPFYQRHGFVLKEQHPISVEGVGDYGEAILVRPAVDAR